MNVILRAVELSDIDKLFEWENNSSLWSLGLTRRPISMYAIEEYVKGAQNDDVYISRQVRFIIDLIEGNETFTVGCVDLYDFDPENLKAGVGILIDKKYRRKNIAINALEKLWEYSRNILHINQLYAYIPEYNFPSLELFSNAGYNESAVLKQWLRKKDGFIDMKIYQKFA